MPSTTNERPLTMDAAQPEARALAVTATVSSASGYPGVTGPIPFDIEDNRAP